MLFSSPHIPCFFVEAEQILSRPQDVGQSAIAARRSALWLTFFV